MDFSAIFQIWKTVLLTPGEAVFEQERVKPTATFNTAIIWIVIAAVITAVLGLLQGLIFFNSGAVNQMIGMMNLPPEVTQQMRTMMANGIMSSIVGGAGLATIISAPIGFVISVGIWHLLAKLLKGQGDFGNYAYLNATFRAPIMIISAILNFVPGLGGCLSALLSIYGLVLTYYATKVEYNLTSGKAIMVVIIPILVVILIFACIIVGFVGLIMSTQNN
ncbi:MAG: YIP1 family protein [Chloroflexi bacterium]|nr:YIP1 family protein [Chloroflexota bacterium]